MKRKARDVRRSSTHRRRNNGVALKPGPFGQPMSCGTYPLGPKDTPKHSSRQLGQRGAA